MRNISFALTTRQFRDRSKTVTRRLGWRFLLDDPPGVLLCGVEKAQGIRKGGLVRLGIIEVVSAYREPLDRITPAHVRREGFPSLSPAEFVEMFRRHMGADRSNEVTVIEFRHLVHFGEPGFEEFLDSA